MMRKIKSCLALGVMVMMLFGGRPASAASAFTLTLFGPSGYVPGQQVSSFNGRLFGPAAVGIPLQSLVVLLDGTPANTSAATDLQGAYAFTLPPISGTADHTVQTVAFSGLPALETRSPVLTLRVVRYQLSVTLTGRGTGVVASNPAGVNCPGSCAASFVAGTSVTLTATPTNGASFGGWSDPSCATDVSCVIVMNSARSVSASFDVSGKLSVSPASFDFGNTSTFNATNPPAPFTVTNTGLGNTGFLSVSITGVNSVDFQYVADGCSGRSLAPSQACSVSIQFRPAIAGAKSATFTVTGSPGGSASAAMSGNGVDGVVSVSPSSFDFGNTSTFNATNPPAPFTVTNTGLGNTGFLSVSITGVNSVDFQYVADGCSGRSLAPSQACSVSIQFRPAIAGAKSATFTVTGSPGGSASAAMSGNGVDGVVSVSPSSFDFGSVHVGSSSSTSFTVTNTGLGNTGFVNVTITGVNSADFQIVFDGCSGRFLSPGTACSVTVDFRPTSIGSKVASLNVAASPGGSSSASMKGTGA